MIKARDSYRACVENTVDKDRRDALLQATDTVTKAGTALRMAAADNSLHALDKADFTVPEIIGDFVLWTYTNGIKTKAGRKLRDQLLIGVIDSRCPFCRSGSVRQLDHFMPKSLFPALCVDPLNLVPVCGDCNLYKGDKQPDQIENTPVHPYLDRIDRDQWLDAKAVHEGGNVRLEFFVRPPASWTPQLRDRVTYHFKLFRLATHSATAANRALTGMAAEIDEHRKRGAEAARVRLLDLAQTWFTSDLNSPEGVAFRALADDPQYCLTGT
ncbi:HNH endonuclease signature motif containing protein [Streptomyces erythrochromogenes]|uniref:HNH endonuclease signature motif containing protein n=1 Tax=Streptomyces erythrochromogenes TaxID=285574 RepID=UPI0036B02CE4